MPKNEKGEQFANVHLIEPGLGTIARLKVMADEIRAIFPQANYGNICASTVISSRNLKGHAIVTWSAYIPAGEYPEWDQRPDGQIEYSW